jgi:Peptidase family M23
LEDNLLQTLKFVAEARHSEFIMKMYWFCPLFILFLPLAPKNCRAQSAGVSTIAVVPTTPLIEKDEYGQLLNFDLIFSNKSLHIIELCGLQVSVYDTHHQLIERKFINDNGRAPSIALLGQTTIRPGEVVCFFNPFYHFPANMPIHQMDFEFIAHYAENCVAGKAGAKRLPIDADTIVRLSIYPAHYRSRTRLTLPLKGRLIVCDGHDYFSHHRRFPTGTPLLTAEGIVANSNRYAYDFNPVDSAGRMYCGDPYRKESWYAYNRPIYAPGAGVVLASENDVPDNNYVNKKVSSPDPPANGDSLGMGNYVIIDHLNGEYSVLLHMRSGSVRVKKGDVISRGQQIGNIGFSGDAINPHLHYTVMSGPIEGKSEGVPSYFDHYLILNSGKPVYKVTGRIDTGDLVESAGHRFLR